MEFTLAPEFTFSSQLKYIKNTPVLLFMYIPHNYPLIVMTSNIKFNAITFVHHHTITNQPKIL